jgi:hypothetical protein
MADTKVSALTAVVTPAGTDEFPVNQGGTSKKETLAQVKTFVNTAPVFAAGSATAGSWPDITAGTLLTTAEAGAWEFDGNCMYMTTDAGNRGVLPLLHFIRQTSTYTLANQGTAQKLFNAVTNGTLTLETGLYRFECMFAISGMSSTSGNAAFGLLGAGTATLARIQYQVMGRDNAINAAGGAIGGTYSTNAATNAAAVTAGTATEMFALVKGTFEVSVAGTIIPSITLLTAVGTAVVGIGSYFMCHRIGAAGVNSVGQWS